MKTLDEAFDLFMTEVPMNESKSEDIESTARLVANQDRYREIHDEFQTNPKAITMAMSLLAMADDMGMCPHQILVIAISHGVCMGIEMEKADL